MTLNLRAICDLLAPGLNYQASDAGLSDYALEVDYGKGSIIASFNGGKDRYTVCTKSELEDGSYKKLFKGRVSSAIKRVESVGTVELE